MNYQEFKVLTYIEKQTSSKIEEKEIFNHLNIEKTISKEILDKFIQNEFINYENGFVSITNNGYKELEPYKVKKAVFCAAGIGSRMFPITQKTPKPLVKINNKPIIETLLDAVVKADIQEIIIVRGYLSNQFEYLKQIYPNVRFIENFMYQETNTISSAYLAREYFENAYILDSDLYLYNPDIIRKYEYASNYLGKHVNKTEDLRYVVENNRIKGTKRGGENCYLMYGIAYFDKEDGIKFKNDVQKVFEQTEDGKKKYFDDVNLNLYTENYNFTLRECEEGDIIEVDTFEELKQVDSSYNDYIE